MADLKDILGTNAWASNCTEDNTPQNRSRATTFESDELAHSVRMAPISERIPSARASRSMSYKTEDDLDSRSDHEVRQQIAQGFRRISKDNIDPQVHFTTSVEGQSKELPANDRPETFPRNVTAGEQFIERIATNLFGTAEILTKSKARPKGFAYPPGSISASKDGRITISEQRDRDMPPSPRDCDEDEATTVRREHSEEYKANVAKELEDLRMEVADVKKDNLVWQQMALAAGEEADEAKHSLKFALQENKLTDGESLRTYARFTSDLVEKVRASVRSDNRITNPKSWMVGDFKGCKGFHDLVEDVERFPKGSVLPFGNADHPEVTRFLSADLCTQARELSIEIMIVQAKAACKSLRYEDMRVIADDAHRQIISELDGNLPLRARCMFYRAVAHCNLGQFQDALRDICAAPLVIGAYKEGDLWEQWYAIISTAASRSQPRQRPAGIQRQNPVLPVQTAPNVPRKTEIPRRSNRQLDSDHVLQSSPFTSPNLANGGAQSKQKSGSTYSGPMWDVPKASPVPEDRKIASLIGSTGTGQTPKSDPSLLDDGRRNRTYTSPRGSVDTDPRREPEGARRDQYGRRYGSPGDVSQRESQNTPSDQAGHSYQSPSGGANQSSARIPSPGSSRSLSKRDMRSTSAEPSTLSRDTNRHASSKSMAARNVRSLASSAGPSTRPSSKRTSTSSTAAFSDVSMHDAKLVDAAITQVGGSLSPVEEDELSTPLRLGSEVSQSKATGTPPDPRDWTSVQQDPVPICSIDDGVFSGASETSPVDPSPLAGESGGDVSEEIDLLAKTRQSASYSRRRSSTGASRSRRYPYPAPQAGWAAQPAVIEDAQASGKE